MKTLLMQKIKNFLSVWLIYLVAGGLLGILIAFVFMPILGWFRFGVIQLIPSEIFVIKMLKGVVASSFALAVVMWICAEWDVLKKHPVTPVAKTGDQ